ncbi:hypothetical protein [Paenibacillus sp. J2TS4]|uniref:hypothetical protein n=1 Tax=Paenibacillus sp. J2TS4 TaxID=2807194 RepID=UPI001B2A5EC0|nr:hypothetical protein [Paenibacillus sp. J2TS4]GIP36193.1 hypothetical protein J2TS4_54030 [Paenibacillus sp. J2TS4]
MSDSVYKITIVTLLILLLCLYSEGPKSPIQKNKDIPSLLGSGNFTNGDTSSKEKISWLEDLNLGWGRLNLYPDWYYKDGKPTPQTIDGLVAQMFEHNITPMLLFEYYGNYESKGIPIGDYNKWFSIGQQFAERFRPGGTWSQIYHVRNWGITVYSAFNEPDVESTIDRQAYSQALEGFADGIHSVDKSLKVIPGGFSAQNAFKDWTLKGYGPAIAPLLNSGKLDGLDLHTYFDLQYTPISGTYTSSVQYAFDQVKKQSGITRDISFYSTEFNVKDRNPASPEQGALPPEVLANYFLTAIWDSLGVVKNDGHSPATEFAMPFSLALTPEQDPWYGLYSGRVGGTTDLTARARVLRMVSNLTSEAYFEYLDPKLTGVYILSGGFKKIWVWQNRKHWTNAPGTEFTITGLPNYATRISIYRWSGLWKTIELKQNVYSYKITGLIPEETYMFVADG